MLTNLSICIVLLAMVVHMTVAVKVLVLGGSGFVGGKLITLLTNRGVEIVALSRRGAPVGDICPANVEYLKCDVGDKEQLAAVFKSHGPFSSVFHAIGLLLDPDSGLSGLNKLASGSGSVPSETSSYDRITRQTSFNAIDLLVAQQKDTGSTTAVPMVFVSAAEAGWTWPSPVGFLERYLIAKRAVESRLQSEEVAPFIRPVILRPSLIYTMDRPQALFSVIPFMVASKIGIPGVEKPVELDVLAKSGIVASENQDIRGVKRIEEMTELSKSFK